MNKLIARTLFVLAAFSGASVSQAGTDCNGLPNFKTVQAALAKVVESGNGGIFKPNAMWATVVNRTGQVCVVAKVGDAWPGSRIISAQKASSANAFSNDKLALSTANIYTAVQPGGSLFGLQESNPVNAAVAYKGEGRKFGTEHDPLVGERIGGINVFGGGLALYAKDKKTVLGGVGVSGDTSCADHNIAWKIRGEFGLDTLPGGLSANKDDNVIYDIDPAGKSAGGFGHPVCSPEATEISKTLKTR